MTVPLTPERRAEIGASLKDMGWFEIFDAARDLLAEVERLEGENAALKATFDFTAHLKRQREFSEKTFGPGARTAGVIAHIRKELDEVSAQPGDLSEWIDVAILALDGAWRSGHSPEQIVAALVAKQAKNEARTWPDWRTASVDKPIEHVRSCNVHDNCDDKRADEGNQCCRTEDCEDCYGQ